VVCWTYLAHDRLVAASSCTAQQCRSIRHGHPSRRCCRYARRSRLTGLNCLLGEGQSGLIAEPTEVAGQVESSKVDARWSLLPGCLRLCRPSTSGGCGQGGGHCR